MSRVLRKTPGLSRDNLPTDSGFVHRTKPGFEKEIGPRESCLTRQHCVGSFLGTLSPSRPLSHGQSLGAQPAARARLGVSGSYNKGALKVSPADADLFFRLYRPLLLYANQQQRVDPSVTSLEQLGTLPFERQAEIRDVLYEQPEVLEKFLSENPAGLDGDELALVEGWRRFIRGNFYIFRYLKQYAVFLAIDPVRAYGVMALHDGFEELRPPSLLPVYAEAVLLPFKGRIIYDGFLRFSHTLFGSGIRRDLNETYQRLRDRGELIRSLEKEGPVRPDAPRRRSRPPAETWPALDRILEAAGMLRNAETPLQTRAFSLLRAAAALADTAARDPDDLAEFAVRLRRVRVAYTQLVTAYNRSL